MVETSAIVLTVSGVLLLANVLASVVVIRFTNATAKEKAAQMALVWLLPLLGAGTVLWVQASIGSRAAPRSPPGDPEVDVWTAYRLEAAEEIPDSRSGSAET